MLTLTTNWLGMGGTISCGGLGRGLVLGLVLWATVASIAAISFSWRASAAAAAAAAASAATASASAPSRGIYTTHVYVNIPPIDKGGKVAMVVMVVFVAFVVSEHFLNSVLK